MRVTLGEIYWGQVLLIIGAMQLGQGKAQWRGFPIPLWTSYILIAVGLAIPLLAWYLRGSLQQSGNQTHRGETAAVLPEGPQCDSQANLPAGATGGEDDGHGPCAEAAMNQEETPRLLSLKPRPADQYMMRVTLAEIYCGFLMVFLGALQFGADKAHMREYPIPFWTAWGIFAVGLVLPLLAWYLRRPGQTPESDKP